MKHQGSPLSTTATASAPAQTEKKKGGARVRVQKFGTFLSSMIMPNIGAFIAWGALTALFLWSADPEGGQGPFASERISTMIGPMVTYLLPILIAYTGGKLIADVRGGVVGAVGTMGVILATSSPVFIGEDGAGSPMFLGAMIMGPLSAWVLKKWDQFASTRIPTGFEMLVNNFSAGIIGAGMAIASMFLLAPIMHWLMQIAGNAVEFLIDSSLLPLASILIEPAKILFLNNAINHGILTPLATDQALQQGHSILFLLEANPGPGLGVLIAYMIFGKGAARGTAPAAAIIHALGGIHEIYFPYVLMKPQLLIATIVGGMSGVLVELIMDAGLRSPAAPGSIIFLVASAPPSKIPGVLLGFLVATVVSAVISCIILRMSKQDEDGLAAATASMESMKGKKSSVGGLLTGGAAGASEASAASIPEISSIVFACDAGMGSSAMGASVLRSKIKDAGFGNEVTVVNKAINSLTDEYDLLVSHEDLADRAATPTPSAHHVTVDNFMQSPRYDEIVELIREQRQGDSAGSAQIPAEQGTSGNAAAGAGAGAAAGTATAVAAAPARTANDPTPADEAAEQKEDQKVLTPRTIVLGAPAATREEAIERAGQLLVEVGAVDGSYVAAMHEREQSVSTFMGNGLAIPHGTNEAKDSIRTSAMSFIRYDEPVDWNGKEARFVIGIAGADGGHMGLLSKIAKIFSKKESVAQLEAAQTPEEILDIFGKVNS